MPSSLNSQASQATASPLQSQPHVTGLSRGGGLRGQIKITGRWVKLPKGEATIGPVSLVWVAVDVGSEAWWSVTIPKVIGFDLMRSISLEAFGVLVRGLAVGRYPIVSSLEPRQAKGLATVKNLLHRLESSQNSLERSFRTSLVLRFDYEFSHTSDAELLPYQESSVTEPIIRLFKPLDELVVISVRFGD